MAQHQSTLVLHSDYWGLVHVTCWSDHLNRGDVDPASCRRKRGFSTGGLHACFYVRLCQTTLCTKTETHIVLCLNNRKYGFVKRDHPATGKGDARHTWSLAPVGAAWLHLWIVSFTICSRHIRCLLHRRWSDESAVGAGFFSSLAYLSPQQGRMSLFGRWQPSAGGGLSSWTKLALEPATPTPPQPTRRGASNPWWHGH